MKIRLFPLFIPLFVASCGDSKVNDSTQAIQEQSIQNKNAFVAGEPCDIKLQNIHFTKSINGADTLALLNSSEVIEFRVGEKKDYFSDPDEKLSNNTAPILLAKIDNKKSFTLMAKVTPTFTKTGLYNAGVLYIYANV